MIKRVVIYNSKQEPLSQSEIKRIIMQAENIKTTEEYNKYYDRMRNRIINYQKIQVATGLKKESEIVAPIKVLYNEAKRKIFAAKHGIECKHFAFYKEALKSPPLSTGKALGKKIEKLQAEREKITKDTTPDELSPDLKAKRESVLYYFSGMINKVPIAKEASEKIIDPYKLEKALIEIADKVHAALEEEKARIDIPDVIIGSYNNISIDINSYLTDKK